MISNIELNDWHHVGYPTTFCSIPLTVNQVENLLGVCFIEGHNNGVGTQFSLLRKIDHIPIHLIGYFNKDKNAGVEVEIQCIETRAEQLLEMLSEMLNLDQSAFTVYLDNFEPNWLVVPNTEIASVYFKVHTEDQARSIARKLANSGNNTKQLVKKI